MRFKTAYNHSNRLSALVRDEFAWPMEGHKAVYKKLQAAIDKLPKDTPKWVAEHAKGLYHGYTVPVEDSELNAYFKKQIELRPDHLTIYVGFAELTKKHTMNQQSFDRGVMDYWISHYYQVHLEFLYVLPEGTFSTHDNSELFLRLPYPNGITSNTPNGHSWKKGGWFSTNMAVDFPAPTKTAPKEKAS